MYNLNPLFLILISLAIIIIIVVRKFPALASLDVENIPAEKEAKFKERIVSNKLKRNIKKMFSVFFITLNFLKEKSGEIFKIIFNKLHALRENYKNEKFEAGSNKEEKEKEIDILFDKVEENYKEDLFDEAEKNLIKIIALDSKNIQAFEALGNLYLEKKNYEESKQTFKHVAKLMQEQNIEEGLAEVIYNLAVVDKENEDFTNAFQNIVGALKIEPNNPRYIDYMLELSIINKDKISAINALEKLNKVNPENKKLEEFRKQINEL